MVRNKQPPQQLNEIQQRRAQWNLIDGAGPADNPRGNGDAEAGQEDDAHPRDDGDDIALLLNNELIDDDDDDADFIPGALGDPALRPREVRWGRFAQVRYEDGEDEFVDEFDDDVAYLPRRRERAVREEVNYGDFKNVLNKSQFYAKVFKKNKDSVVSPRKERDNSYFCNFGNISFKLKDKVTCEDLHQIPSSEFWVYVTLEANSSALYFEWSSGESPKKSKQRKKPADNFRHYMIEGVLNAELWQGLSTQRYFDLKLESFDDVSNEMTLSVFLKKGGLSELKHPSDNIQCNESLGAVVSYFFGVHMFAYTGTKNLKHDVEDLFTAVKHWHADKEYCSIDVQHPSLIPQLRPYQKAAVKWMLHQEKFGQVKNGVDSSSDVHCLFVAITSKDNVTLYFNRYGGFLVKDKPLAVLPTPGGILADEMGLGKTVEVLSCMLCHPRQNIKKPDYQEPINIESRKTSNGRKSSKRLTGNDIFTLDGVPEEEEEEEVKGNVDCFLKDSKTEHITEDSKTEHITEDSKTEHMEDSKNELVSMDSNMTDVTGEMQNFKRTRNSKRKTTASQVKKDSRSPENRIKVHIPKREKEDDDKLNKTRRPKTRAAKFCSGYVSLDDDDDKDSDNNYEPPEKKKCIKKTRTKKTAFNVEQEISDCTYWSSIESAIVKECWDGRVKDYKKEGSFKDFCKFLRTRKKDPYYMMSLREKLQIQYNISMAKYSAREVVTRKTIQGFFDTKVAQKSYFECLCGSAETEIRDEKFRVQCSVCSLWQHADCVQYDVTDPYRGVYICPHCWTQEKPVVSGATLIVTPSSISYQWVNEIMKHLKHKAIRMLVYKGVSTQGYMQPLYLANFDIVITTYETLSRELNYVDLPHSNSQMGRRFRHPKRFMATPSPLPCVEWWRVCLDEAQMVECTTNKTAEMALRLAATNRWCVTGTPVQKTVNELQGLLMFLGVDPYWVAQWWNRCLFLPYCHGVKEQLHNLVAQYMWRNAKKDVIHQIDIPQQVEEVHWLSFTRVEEHFYQRLHAECSYDAQQRLKKFTDIKTKLSSLDRPTLNSLLHPLLKLRQACNHPQVVKGQFLSMNRKTMTMEMLLENLIKKTKLETEEAHRLLISSMNGLAGVHIIQEEWSQAVEMYRAVLRSIQEHANIKTDSLQRLHTLHNLAEVLEAGHSNIEPTLRDSSLREESETIRKRYLQHYPQQVAAADLECTQNSKAVESLEKNLNLNISWWLGALESFDDDFVLEVRDEMLSSYSRFEEHKCLLFPVKTRAHLQLVLNAEMKKLKDQRLEMINAVRHLQTLDPASLLDGAIDCHLRPAESEPPQCMICATHELFEEYEETLFSMRELKHSRTTGVSKETQDVKDKAQVMLATRRGHWGQSENERLLRYLQTKSLERVEREIYNDSQTHFKIWEATKKEFKNYRILWRAIFDSVSAMDEVNMATIRLRLRFPDEEIPKQKKKKDRDDLEKKTEALRYVLELGEVPQQELKLKSQQIVATNDLKIKLGQLLYLQNLAKTDFGKDGGKNPEPCPICQGELGEKWAVLLCGHCYCMECMRTLSNRGFNGTDKSAVKCPMCRQPTRTREISYVDTKAKEVEDVKVQGSLSTKMEGVVRLMLKIKLADPEAKVLVFSSWADVLDVIADAFAQNGITYRALHQRSKFQRHLASFKTSNQITALLLPISSGANGLNIIEARHVILVEPILNPAAELQAIGRVHRIGQTKETIVHRFLVRGTIEERMYHILRHHHESHHTDENTVTIEDLKNLFLHPEELELQKELIMTRNQISASERTTGDRRLTTGNLREQEDFQNISLAYQASKHQGVGFSSNVDSSSLPSTSNLSQPLAINGSRSSTLSFPPPSVSGMPQASTSNVSLQSISSIYHSSTNSPSQSSTSNISQSSTIKLSCPSTSNTSQSSTSNIHHSSTSNTSQLSNSNTSPLFNSNTFQLSNSNFSPPSTSNLSQSLNNNVSCTSTSNSTQVSTNKLSQLSTTNTSQTSLINFSCPSTNNLHQTSGSNSHESTSDMSQPVATNGLQATSIAFQAISSNITQTSSFDEPATLNLSQVFQ
nr:E3 ubiquitin-protein ligase SHPRH-like [Procambarus clarkii]XP_045617517.1 E3 ubiquitin-protein ligase SHPRH-like [Procambarus clarkii]